MRQNNHIINRNNYQDFSSFKIRQPFNQHTYQQRSNLPHKINHKSKNFYQNQQLNHINKHNRSTNHYYDYKQSNEPYNQSNSYSSFYDKYPHRNPHHHQNRQNSRQLSYNSRGSNTTKNSIKMTDYIALQAKNLIQNKDKYKFDGLSHMRSSSMHCYPNSFKVTRASHQKNYNYNINSKQQNLQPTQIPSFGLQCRTTISGYNAGQKSHSLNKYPINSYKIQDPSISTRFQNRNIKTQIDERIQKLKASSTSTRHKQRMSNIQKIDENRIENMDKINIKIKNILTTLQKQEDHYKKRFVQGNGRIKTQSTAVLQSKYEKMLQQDYEQSLLSKYTKGNNESYQKYSRLDNIKNDISNNSFSNLYQNEDSFINHTDQSFLDKSHQQINLSHNLSHNEFTMNNKTNKYHDNNISSYYYYQDQSAMLKSSQSPLKSSPQKSFKKYSIEKDKQKSQFKHSKTSQQIYKPKYTQNQSNKSTRLIKQSQNPSLNQKYSKQDFNLLNIPECETQIIQSKAFSTNNNLLMQNYHTFDTKKSQLSYHNDNFYNKSMATNNQQAQKQSKSKNINNDIIGRKQKQQAKQNRNFSKQKRNIEVSQQRQSQTEFVSTINSKKNYPIYFKIDDQDKYLRSANRQKVNENHSNQTRQLRSTSGFNRTYKNSTTTFDQHKLSKFFQNQRNSDQKPNYLQTFNQNINKKIPYDKIKKDYCYSDSIKQTPRMQQTVANKHSNIQVKNCSEYKRSNYFKPTNDQKLQQKLKVYEQRLQKYQKGMSASKILDSQRSYSNGKSNELKILKSSSIQKSQQKKYSNKLTQTNSALKKLQLHSKNSQNISDFIPQQNIQKLLLEIRKERFERDESNKKSKSNSTKEFNFKLNHQNHNHQYKEQPFNTSQRQLKNQPRQSHRFAKDDHQKFIQNLRKDRQEVAQLSQRKSRKNHCISVDDLRPQRSPQRSESQNSRLSSNTVIKGKNIDEQISKIQRKMQDYQKMKKQLHLESQQNTQRSIKKDNIIKQVSVQKQQKIVLNSEYKFNKDQRLVKFDNKLNIKQQKYETKKQNNKPKQNNTPKPSDLLKIVSQQNTYVKVRNSILKQHKTNQIKHYLNDQILKQSNRQKSEHKKLQNQLKQNYSSTSSKQNILPPTTTTIDSPKYPNGSKKVVLGLAQNLILNTSQQVNNIQNIPNGIKNDIKTPKLLRNLKNKITDKSIIMKKAQKRGFRSQFINDLHEDNEIIASAKKNQLNQEGQDIAIQTQRYLPQNRQLLMRILGLIQKQILIDQKFRNQKKGFNAIIKKDKWNDLMNQYIRQLPNQHNVLLSDIVQIFTLSQQESNPFYSTRGVQFDLGSLVSTYVICRQNWNDFLMEMSSFSYDKVLSCGLNSKSLDIQRKGFIDVDDLTRFINMELNKYYRKRDLWLIWKRIVKSDSYKNKYQSQGPIQFQKFSRGLGFSKQTI